MKHKILKLSALLILPFVFLGCTYYQGLNELKAKIKPNELDVTVVDAKFTNVKRSIIANTPRCFSSMYNVSGDCTIHTNNSKILEVSCSRKMNDSYLGSSKVNVLVPYIKAAIPTCSNAPTSPAFCLRCAPFTPCDLSACATSCPTTAASSASFAAYLNKPV